MGQQRAVTSSAAAFQIQVGKPSCAREPERQDGVAEVAMACPDDAPGVPE